jgi:CubicO group peptidase (beta-lactamase class C family)
MTDTGFSVPAAQTHRFVPAYWPDPTGGAPVLHDDVADSRWRTSPAFPDGGAGLVSTVDDFATFGRMLLANGTHGRARILSRPSVELMTTDHLTSAQKAAVDFAGFFDDHGFGFGMSVVTRRDGLVSLGQFGWDGGFGTAWASDPREDLTAILMTQVAGFTLLSPVHRDFWTSTYQAIAD